MLDEYQRAAETVLPSGLEEFVEGSGEGWDVLLKKYSGAAGERAVYLKDYLTWAYGPVKDPVIDLRSRPPVGRFSPPPGTKFLPNGKVKLPPRSTFDREKMLAAGGKSFNRSGG